MSDSESGGSVYGETWSEQSDAKSSDEEESGSEEEEVLPITDDEGGGNDKDDSDKDNEEYGLPNKDSWGKKKSSYYSADFVDEDRGRTYREEDMERAKLEEEEALAIQKSVYSNIQADNLKAYMMSDSDDEVDVKEVKEVAEAVHDWASVSKQEKLKYLKKTSPEFLGFIKGYREKLSELENVILPMHQYLQKDLINNEAIIKYIKMKYQLLLNYCMNVTFYMMLKSKGLVISNHPVFQRIKSFHELLDDLDNTFSNVKKMSTTILKKLKSNKKVALKLQSQAQKRKTDRTGKSTKKIKISEENTVAVEPATEEKRSITYQIAKNKGLVTKRKKEHRNPRVHHRMKFKKANIRRKGQVRGVVKEITRYEGEPTGISANVVKSIKFK